MPWLLQEANWLPAMQEFYATSGLATQSGPGFDEMQWPLEWPFWTSLLPLRPKRPCASVRLVSSKPTRDTERCWNWKNATLDIAGTLAARGWSYNGYPVSADYFGSYSLRSCTSRGLQGIWHSREHKTNWLLFNLRFHEVGWPCRRALGNVPHEAETR